MIVIHDTKDSGPPPPTFEQSADHVVLDFSPDAPPQFTPYQANFFKLSNGWIISHDPHLNQDGLSPQSLPISLSAIEHLDTGEALPLSIIAGVITPYVFLALHGVS